MQVQDPESELLQQMLSIQWKEEFEFKQRNLGLQTFCSRGGAESRWHGGVGVGRHSMAGSAGEREPEVPFKF